jgi:hypothetical protein
VSVTRVPVPRPASPEVPRYVADAAMPDGTCGSENAATLSTHPGMERAPHQSRESHRRSTGLELNLLRRIVFLLRNLT